MSLQQLREQERELERVALLAARPKNGVEIENKHISTFSNVNGAISKHETKEQKVIDPASATLLSDVKEHIQETQASPDSKPKTEIQASVDIPSEGIHQTLTNNQIQDTEDESQTQTRTNMDAEADKETIQFSPRVVAEYLLKTGETQEFKETLKELVVANEMTEKEAVEYESKVWEEYLNLVKGEKESSDQATLSEEVYPIYGLENPPIPSRQDSDRNNYLNYFLDKPVTLDAIINTLLDEWMTRAIVTGDPEAEAILRNIVDYVSRDQNPNDEQQVQEILADLFADAIMEDLSPRIVPEVVQNEELQSSEIISSDVKNSPHKGDGPVKEKESSKKKETVANSDNGGKQKGTQ
ncbi:hypothetical protein ACJMK2_025407 [Sinanodonta woodiana]|uniref:Uncharacterized protein n=1 Tax=Sinanodonta woodiana TaxID=1069815 RepID=A0ABD3XGD8_SINWO